MALSPALDVTGYRTDERTLLPIVVRSPINRPPMQRRTGLVRCEAQRGSSNPLSTKALALVSLSLKFDRTRTSANRSPASSRAANMA